jgi:repressor LexA
MKRPTKKQFELLTYLDKFIKEHGYGPSYREVMSGLGYKSVATVAVHINHLVELGYVAKKDRSARSLYIVQTADEATVQLRTNQVKPAQEKWLVEKVEALLASVEAEPNEEQLNNVYVLIGALKVLGLDGAAQGFIPRLKVLRDTLQAEV